MPFNRNSNIKITVAQSTSKAFYSSIGFQERFWDTLGGSSYPVTRKSGRVVLTNLARNANARITRAQSMARSFYESITFAFGTVWAIREGVEFPRPIKRGVGYVEGLPGQSIRWYVFVEISNDGTMYYNNEIYKSLKNGIKISMFEGTAGEVVKHVWGGKKVPDNKGKVHVFLASGVQDPDYPGNYGHYTDETERTVTLRDDRSINVNFYYIDAGLPSYNYLLRIAVPDGVAHLAIMKDDVSEIKVQMHDGSVCTVALVPLDDVQASPIRVMTTNGIFALKKIELFD